MDPMTLMAIQQVAGTGVNFLSNLFNRPKSFDQTSYGKRLKMLSEQGMFSGAAKSNILGQVGAQTGNVAQQAKTDYKGRMISQGMGGSIAGQQGLANIDMQRMGQMSSAAKDIETQNEMSKAQYGLQYDQAKTGYAQQLQDYDRNTVTGLIQGATSALGTYAQGLGQRQQQETLGVNYKDSGMNKSDWIKTYISAYNARTSRDQSEGRIKQNQPPDITKSSYDDLRKYILSGTSESDKDARLKYIYDSLMKAGKAEDFLNYWEQ